MEIIDARVRLRTRILLKAWTTHLNPVLENYIDLYQMHPRLTEMSTKKLLEHASECGVKKMVVCGGNQEENEHIYEVAKKYDSIIPVGGVKLESGIKASIDQVKRLRDQGFNAVNISPLMEGINMNDRLFYPVFGYCEFIGMPVTIHASIHFDRRTYMWVGQPQYADEVAVDFPELKMILSHGGNGFGPPVLAVAQRHPNVFLEFSALNPKFMAPEFIQAANTYLSKKCIFGTDYPLIDFDQSVKCWKEALRESVWASFFHQNILDALHNPPVPLSPL
jgi:uncharacterized protein